MKLLAIILAICTLSNGRKDGLAIFRTSFGLMTLDTGKLNYVSTKITYEGLVEKLDTEKYPLFEFRSDLEMVIEENNSSVSVIAIENLLNKYLNGLQKHYFEEFCRRYDSHLSLPVNPLFQKDTLKRKILRECEVAFLKSIPSSMIADCNYEVGDHYSLRLLFVNFNRDL